MGGMAPFLDPLGGGEYCWIQDLKNKKEAKEPVPLSVGFPSFVAKVGLTSPEKPGKELIFPVKLLGMKCCFRWLAVAGLAASLSLTTPRLNAHSMGGFAGGGSHFAMGHGFGRPAISRHDNRFFNAGHRFADRGHRFTGRDRFDHDRFFFHHHRSRAFFAFDFAAFGFPWWYPYPYPYNYDYPYAYPYDDYGQAYDEGYWNNLAVAVQSELARRGYYHDGIDGIIGPGSRNAIRAFQAARGLPVTGLIDPNLLNALGISYRNA